MDNTVVEYHIRKLYVGKLVRVINKWKKSNNIQCTVIIGFISVSIHNLSKAIIYNLKQYLEINHPQLIYSIVNSKTIITIYAK